MKETNTKQGVAAMFKRPLLAGALAATAAAAPTAGNAATDIFLDLTSAGILGEATAEKHKNQIEILSFSLGFVNQTSGSAAGGGAGKVSCGDMILTKSIDKSSPSLISAVMTGKHIPTGTLAFTVATSKDATVNYYVLTLSELLVTAINQSDSVGGPRVAEQVTISAAKFKFQYRTQNANGTFGAFQTFSFDCAASKST